MIPLSSFTAVRLKMRACLILVAAMALQGPSRALGSTTGSAPSAARAPQESPDPANLRYEYASEHQALQEAFPAAGVFVLRSPQLPDDLRDRLQQELRRPLPEQLRLYLAYSTDGTFRGYGVVTEEIGKHRPITFMVAMDPQPSVLEVQVLVYRESRGGEVRYRRFLRQFEGKDPNDRLRAGRDILNVTGATLSVRAITAGVRRVLATVQGLFADGAPDLSTARSQALEIYEAGAVTLQTPDATCRQPMGYSSP